MNNIKKSKLVELVINFVLLTGVTVYFLNMLSSFDDVFYNSAWLSVGFTLAIALPVFLEIITVVNTGDKFSKLSTAIYMNLLAIELISVVLGILLEVMYKVGKVDYSYYATIAVLIAMSYVYLILVDTTVGCICHISNNPDKAMTCVLAYTKNGFIPVEESSTRLSKEQAKKMEDVASEFEEYTGQEEDEESLEEKIDKVKGIK